MARQKEPALSMSARTLCLEWVVLDRADPEPLEMARVLAQRAIDIDPLDPTGHQELGRAALYRDALDDALEHLQNAVSRGPNHADILANYADTLIHNSTSMREAKRIMDEALELNPLAPDEYFWIGATAEFFLGDYASASATLTRMKRPEAAARFIAAVAALTGDRQTATHYRQIFLSRHPDFRLADWRMPLRNKADKERYVEALRLAGFH